MLADLGDVDLLDELGEEAAHDEAAKDTCSAGELVTAQHPPAPDFTGDVLTATGARDALFCVPADTCADVAQEAQFYPAARSVEYCAWRSWWGKC